MVVASIEMAFYSFHSSCCNAEASNAISYASYLKSFAHQGDGLESGVYPFLHIPVYGKDNGEMIHYSGTGECISRPAFGFPLHSPASAKGTNIDPSSRQL